MSKKLKIIKQFFEPPSFLPKCNFTDYHRSCNFYKDLVQHHTILHLVSGLKLLGLSKILLHLFNI